MAGGGRQAARRQVTPAEVGRDGTVAGDGAGWQGQNAATRMRPPAGGSKQGTPHGEPAVFVALLVL